MNRASYLAATVSLLSNALPAAAAPVSPPQDDIVIGLVVPYGLAGATAYAQHMSDAAAFARDFINERGGVLGRRLDIAVGDDAGDPKQAVSVANAMIGRHPVAVIGHGLSPTTRPAADIYKENHIPLLATANADDITMPPSPYVTRLLPGNADYARAVETEVERQMPATGPVYLVDDTTPYGKGMIQDLKPLSPASIAARTVEAHITPGDRNFSAIVTSMKAAHAKLIVLSTGETEAGLIVRQSAAVDYHPRFIGHSKLTFDDFPTAAGVPDVANVTIVAIPGCDPTSIAGTPDRDALTAAFRAQGKNVSDIGVIVASAVQMIAEAIARDGNTDPLPLMDTVRHGNLPTVGGVMKYDDNGNPVDLPLITCRWVPDGSGYRKQQLTPSPK